MMKQAEGVVVQQGTVPFPGLQLGTVLFRNRKLAWFWAVIRLYLGYEWLHAGLPKLSDPAWMENGSALKGFWAYAVTIPAEGRPPIAYGWYRDFISFMLEQGWYTWFAKLVVVGEILVGVALILGAFVGLAAFAGGFMNWNYIMAGSASTNAMLLTLAVLLMLAWRVAGWFGLDRLLLPWLSARLSRGAAPTSEPSPAPAPARPRASSGRS